MSNKPAPKERARPFIRQKSFVERSDARKMPSNRSKTPPPRLNHGLQTAVSKDNISEKPVLTKNISSTGTLPRSRPLKAARSVDDLNGLNAVRPSVKSQKDILSPEDILDLRYNGYLQVCLMAAHAKNVWERRESKNIKQLEQILRNLLALDDKMINLTVASEKVKLYKLMKEKFFKEIQDYEGLNSSIDITKIEELITSLQQDLSLLKLKNFYGPTSIQETHEINQVLEDINEDLKLLPDLEKKILPLVHLHSALMAAKENIQEEKKLKNLCEEKLKEAEELIIHECYVQSLKESA